MEEVKKLCHDCEKEIEVEGEEIKNGVLLNYEEDGEKISVFKCKECHEKNPSLTNFRKCEVYSRIVGYLRPVQQWNEGKKLEFETRTEYKISEI
ncbi:MAG: anaerobic ribonucleoside-triphosphate reductase [Candidatus Nealsonbacteria bacterium]